MTPEFRKFYDSMLECVGALIALDPPADSPEGRLLVGLATSLEEFEKTEFPFTERDVRTATGAHLDALMGIRPPGVTDAEVRSLSGMEAILAIADLRAPDGTVYPAEELKRTANGRTTFWDEARQALIYRGPVPPPSYTCRFCQRVSYNGNDIAQRYCGHCHKFAINQ
jgi:hypothetical protein